MQVMRISRLVQLRERLDITREDIVRRSDVTVGTVRNAEKGLKITRRSALQILHAVNSYLRDARQPEVVLDDLGFSLKESCSATSGAEEEQRPVLYGPFPGTAQPSQSNAVPGPSRLVQDQPVPLMIHGRADAVNLDHLSRQAKGR